MNRAMVHNCHQNVVQLRRVRIEVQHVLGLVKEHSRERVIDRGIDKEVTFPS